MPAEAGVFFFFFEFAVSLLVILNMVTNMIRMIVFMMLVLLTCAVIEAWPSHATASYTGSRFTIACYTTMPADAFTAASHANASYTISSPADAPDRATCPVDAPDTVVSVGNAQDIINWQQARLLITDDGFHPHRLHVRKGKLVRLEIRNLSAGTHTFVLPEYNVYSFLLRKGEAVMIEFTPDRTGSFLFFSDASGAADPPKGKMLVR